MKKKTTPKNTKLIRSDNRKNSVANKKAVKQSLSKKEINDLKKDADNKQKLAVNAVERGASIREIKELRRNWHIAYDAIPIEHRLQDLLTSITNDKFIDGDTSNILTKSLNRVIEYEKAIKE